MSLRSLLLFIGLLCLGAGVTLSVVWLGQNDAAPVAQAPKIELETAILVATRPIPSGVPVMQADMGWKAVQEIPAGSGALVRGQASDAEFVGAITRRSFSQDEPLTAADLVKTGDRKFLAAALGPGKRALAVPVEFQQSSTGLILPGDRVDVILTHVLGEASGSLSTPVAETILRDVRIIAVDQTLPPGQNPAPPEPALLAEPKPSRVVTLEVDERQAQALAVGLQLGKLQLVLRSLESSPQAAAQRDLPPTFASDISPALRALALRTRPVQSSSPVQPSSNPLESSIRRPPVIGKGPDA
jgi:pilus assembly protein CpaB